MLSRLSYLFVVLFFASCAKIDDSMMLFFPKEVKNLQSAQTEFPAFWWNFIVIEADKGNADFAKANLLCDQLKKEVGQSLRMLICGDNMSSGLPLLIQWGQDIIYREKFDLSNKRKYFSLMNEALMQVSFVNQKDLLPLFRNDPFQSWQSFLQISQRPEFSKLIKKNGFMISPKTLDIIIPVQFALRPQMSTSESVMSLIHSDSVYHMIGAHAASYLNEKQVRDDMQVVSIISGIVFLSFVLILFLRNRWVAILVFIPTLFSIWAASVITSWIYGSVHGLTLAFGSGIAGLAMDYGLHGAFGADQKQTWKSNVIGLITTLCGVGILTFSGIPLIRQMMVFAIIGLGIGFTSFYFISKYLSTIFRMKSLPIKFPVWRYSLAILAGIIGIGFLAIPKLHMSMDLRKLSFMSKKDEAIAKQIFADENPNLVNETILLVNENQQELTSNYEQKKWAEENQIHYEGLGNYFPSKERLDSNLRSWQQKGCLFLKTETAQQQKNFFEPFIDSACEPTADLNLLNRSYVNHLIYKDTNLTIFSTNGEDKTQSVLQKYPMATSLGQALKDFSSSLSKDLSWMIPVAILLTLFVLTMYYRSALCVFTAMFPFITGLATYFVMAILLNLEINLISLLGLVMVFGFSIDYGVFSTDVHKHKENNVEQKSVYSALTLAAIANLLGFFPMLFAKHPVLLNLGAALFYGTLGTYIGTIWGVYVLYSRKSQQKNFWYF